MLSTKLKEAAGNSADATLYSNDVFSVYLYTGNATSQTINNGIDLAGKGGLVWCKGRNIQSDNSLLDTVRGGGMWLGSNSTQASTSYSGQISSFNSNGFSIGDAGWLNGASATYASWTFRKAAKFFDVVTWTGDGTNYRTINHSLGITPGMVIVKSTSAGGSWAVWHKGSDPSNLILNSTSAAISGQWSVQDVASTSFAVANSSFYSFPQSIPVNDSGQTYVAYLFAHDTSSTGIIQCGSFTNDSSGAKSVSLGYEPQFVLVRASSTTDNWQLYDTMRGMSVTDSSYLYANSSAAETAAGYPVVAPTATGFVFGAINSFTYIYMAIRMPNKPPTTGTQVFEPVIRAGTDSASGNTIPTSFAVDLLINKNRNSAVNFPWVDRLRGFHQKVTSNDTSAEITMTTSGPQSFNNTDIPIGPYGTEWNVSAGSFMEYLFKRAPGFFDEVCYTGNGTTQNINHNLTSSPELLIFADRTSSGANFRTWQVVCSQLGLSVQGAWLCFTNAFSTSYANIITAATSTTFSLDSSYGAYTPNVSTHTYVAYLFATLAGISKVGSYTGNGTGQAIACGFSAGARFVLIKRTDSTGDWYTFDSARGLTSGSSPYLLLNSTAAEVTGNNGVYASTGGFTLATSAAGLNASGGTYIFLAVA